MTNEANNPTTLRLFRLRNGITVVEHHRPNTIRDTKGNFIDDYVGATPEDVAALKKEVHAYGCLTLTLLFNGSFPKGGSHGPDFDIIEELTNTTSEETNNVDR